MPSADISTGDVKTPSIDLPSTEIDVDAPSVQVPSTDVDLDLPSADIEKSGGIDVNIPDGGAGFSLPSVSADASLDVKRSRSSSSSSSSSASSHGGGLSFGGGLPSVSVPAVEIPSADLDIDTPSVDVPSVDLDVETPSVDVPSVDLDLKTQSIDAPSVDIDAEAPSADIKTPSIDIETPSLGSVETPDVKPPSMGIEAPSGDLSIDAPEASVDISGNADAGFSIPGFGKVSAETPDLSAGGKLPLSFCFPSLHYTTRFQTASVSMCHTLSFTLQCFFWYGLICFVDVTRKQNSIQSFSHNFY